MNKHPERSLGVIANPYSSRDIRRVVACASTIQNTERANIVVRVIAALSVAGVDKVYIMPDKSGLCAQIIRSLHAIKLDGKTTLPDIEYLDIPITETVEDSEKAAEKMASFSVDAILVLGGDGTHRAVSKYIKDIPMACVSTGTNNAFPHFHEATLVGMALGLVINNLVPESHSLRKNKILKIYRNKAFFDIALVDVAVTDDHWIGARALWRSNELKEIFLSFCEPSAIGMSAIGGLMSPTTRDEMQGLHITLSQKNTKKHSLNVPIAPGLFEQIDIESYSPMNLSDPIRVKTKHGVLALDGEREIEFTASDDIHVTLSDEGPVSIKVNETLDFAARQGVFIHAPKSVSASEPV